MFAFCPTCKKTVNAGDRSPYLCPTCGHDFTVRSKSSLINREANRRETGTEITLREDAVSDLNKIEAELVESFKALGLSEIAAKVAAKGRDTAEALGGDLDKLEPIFDEGKLREGNEDEDNIVRAAVSQLLLEENFKASGMSEIQAREAARGRDGLGDAVMDVFRNARQIMKSTENLEEASLEDHFMGMGLNETAAKQAAKGHK